MNFSEAMKAAQEGAAVSCWGENEFVYWVPPASYPAQTAIAKAYFGENVLVPYNDYFAKKGWLGLVEPYHPTEVDLRQRWSIVTPTLEQRKVHEKMAGIVPSEAVNWIHAETASEAR